MSRQVRYNINQHLPALQKVLNALPDIGHLTLLKEYAVHDDCLLYKMVARFTPLSYLQCLELIQGFILAEKNDEEIISEEGETEVSKLTNVLMIRAGGLRSIDEYMAAAEVVFAVIKAIEPELPNVYDEGWGYQTILNDAFEFMTDMAKEISDTEVLEQLHKLTLDHFESRDEADSYYEHQFEELLAVISKI